MTTSTSTEQRIDVVGRSLRVLQGGTGDPLVFLHHSIGNPGWIPFFDKLGENFAVTVPDLPGYGQSERPEWARHPRDMAIILRRAIEKLNLGRVHLAGAGFGGWIAAEMASMSGHDLRSLTLIGSAGLQPEEGEIADVIFYGFDEYVKLGFSSDEAYAQVFGEEAAPELKELWDFSREMTARLTWKPWMFNKQLGQLLTEASTPTLLIWGGEDRVVPVDAGKQYEKTMPNAQLEVIAGKGHLVELEDPDGVAKKIADFAKGK